MILNAEGRREMISDETMQARIVKMALEWVEQLLSQNRIAAKAETSI